MTLKEYREKRDFEKTSEPKGKPEKKSGKSKLRYLVQKHDASRLHYDFRLELDGVLKSWAVPKGPSFDPADKRLAVQVEDHPVEYADFEGTIPKGEYGGGTVMLWDEGTWEPIGNPRQELRDGALKFTLHGKRLKGAWTLIRMKRNSDEEKNNWLLIKEKDEQVRRNGDHEPITESAMTSVTTSRTMEQIAKGTKSRKKGSRGGKRIWKSGDGDDESEGDGGARTSRTYTDASHIPGARKAPLPDSFSPQLATLVQSPPEGKEWVYEIKFDGYRILAFLENGSARLVTRNGKDWTRKLPELAEILGAIPCRSALVDGEMVAVDDSGHSSFQVLQNALHEGRTGAIQYYAFDLVHLDGYDLANCTLEDRKSALESLWESFDHSAAFLYSEHFTGDGETIRENACRMKLEGIICKDLMARYVNARTKSWLKVKCSRRQEFVIGGYTDPEGGRNGFGALLTGVYDDRKRFLYSGKVGTGFTHDSLEEIGERLGKLETSKSPFTGGPRGSARGIHWVRPELVCEIAFTEWTADHHLRHPSFQGLRSDKKAASVHREEPVEMTDEKKPAKKAGGLRKQTAGKAASKRETKRAASNSAEGSATRLSHPDRVLFPDDGYTKADLYRYFEAVATSMLPYAVGRPVTMLRCPEGQNKPCFYQRHVKTNVPDGFGEIEISVKGGKETYLYVQSKEGLLELAQMSCLEVHGWQCSVDDLEHPDMMVFDVDPDEGLEWPKTMTAARELRGLLEGIGFTAFLKTTGGKGLHVVVPLEPSASWDELREFAEAVARTMESQSPDLYIATMSKARRKGKIYIDYLRNTKTASAVLPYSPRARKGATVAFPIAWEELTSRLDPKKLTIRTVPSRLRRRKKDPWADYNASRKPLDIEKIRSL